MSRTELNDLFADHWDWTLRCNPVMASELGDHRFDDQLPAGDRDALDRESSERAAFLARARAIDPATLGDDDRVSRELLIAQLEADAATEICFDEQWKVSVSDGPLATLAEAAKRHAGGDLRHLAARLSQGTRLCDEAIEHLRAGLAAGRVAAAETVRRAIAQLDGELARPVAEWSMNVGGALVDTLERLRPALQRYRDVIATEVLPRARTGGDEGLGSLPGGDACYRAEIRAHLGVERTPEALHAIGLAEIARCDEELAALGAKVLGTRDLATTLARLRGDPALRFRDADDLLATGRAVFERARAAAPRWFGRLPRTECVVAEVPAHEAPFTGVAYYLEPHPDGSKPGEFFLNTFRPEERPRYDLAAVTVHEAIPGHHLQAAIAQELEHLPAFRKVGGSTAYIEGWALYCERLADEMGLYASDLDRIGMVNLDAVRAARLVVDTGLHALRWTRAEAEAYLLAHCAISVDDASNEIDRYVGLPGQALAYKFGQLEIAALRREAERALGATFDLPGFHDVVIGAGAVTLPVLRAQVTMWIGNREGSTC